MNVDRIRYRVLATVRFERWEVSTLIELSQRHYDPRCRGASEQGGVLFGMHNKLGLGASGTVTWDFDISEYDLLTKIAEDDPAMLMKMARVLNEISNIEQEANENRKA